MPEEHARIDSGQLTESDAKKHKLGPPVAQIKLFTKSGNSMDTLLGWMAERLHEWNKNKSDLRLKAINGLTSAISSTVLYTEKLKRGEPNDTAQEELLYSLWYGASSEVIDYDRELAKRCLDKSEYWLNSKLYNPEKVKELNISLVGMKATLEQIKHN